MKRLVTILSLAFSFANSWATDPQFTQFYSAPLYLSPSLAGATPQGRISSNYRNQWPSIPNGFVTYTLAVDHYISRYNCGIGFLAMNDRSGTGKYGNSYLNLLYSYDISVNRQLHIRPGVSVAYRTFLLDFQKLHFYDQITSSDPSQPTIEQAPSSEIRGHMDGAASLMVYDNKNWMGLTVDHLFKPNQSFFGDKIPTPIKVSVFGGHKFTNRSRLLKPTDESITLSYLYKVQGDYKQLDLGFYYSKGLISTGLWYRGIPWVNSQWGDALALLLGIRWQQLSIGYSYDFTFSNLINSTGGAHEVSLILEFKTSHLKPKKKFHAVPCPHF